MSARSLLTVRSVVCGVVFAVATLACTTDAPPQAVGGQGAGPQADTWAPADWAVFQAKVRWALENGVDTLPMGEATAALGRSLVGTPYVPHTLEAPGPEALVVNFQALDCVTFVENVLALAHFVRGDDAAALLEDQQKAQARYAGLLTRIRYRDGVIEGYPSRLHYFSEWISNGEAKGLVRDMGQALGGVEDREPVTFMTAHPDAYRQLDEDPALVEALSLVEGRLSATARWYIPEGRIDAAAEGIQNGDIIAATSTVGGLDVAHTGLALWVDGTLRLMHAPLVGDSVQISEETLARRVMRISGQDGIMVARPCGEDGAC